MKRIKILLLSIVFCTLFGCSNGSFEDVAIGSIKPIMELVVNDPQSVIIQDVKTIISNDSLCVIHFLLKSKNRFGGYETNRIEYVCVKGKDSHEVDKEIYCLPIFLDIYNEEFPARNQSVLEYPNENRSYFGKEPVEVSDFDDFDMRILFQLCWLRASVNGRKYEP